MIITTYCFFHIIAIIPKMKTLASFFKVVVAMFALYPRKNIVGILLIPVIASLLNNYVNRLLLKEGGDILMCLLSKGCLDYVSLILQQGVFYRQSYAMYQEFLLRLELAKIYCGVSIPGINQAQFKDLLDDASKLRDFIFVLPMLWSSIVSFSITIYLMETNSDYPVRLFFGIFCIIMCGIITYFTDASIYEKSKPQPNKIIKFKDAEFVKLQLSMDKDLDTKFEANRQKQIEKQQSTQKYVIVLINLITTYMSLITKSIGQLHAFGSISWMVGSLADNIKSLQYYTYVEEFITLCKCLEYHKYKTDKHLVPVGYINSVSFVNTSFGYYMDDLTKAPAVEQKITNFSYTFNKGHMYYIEAVNGIGKSTMLKMFTCNIFGGDIFFGSINRKNLSFEDVAKSVFHVVQASEYTPSFSKTEIEAVKGKDPYLEERLGLSSLFGKGFVEMSGGQKKRMLIYLVLTSSAPIILLDEILAEISVEETKEVLNKDGNLVEGGWLIRVIQTIADWEGRKNKIIILVGHGLLDLMPNKESVLKLKMIQGGVKTILV